MVKDIRFVTEKMDKIEFIRTNCEDKELIDFINDIKDSQNRPMLYEELKYYVPSSLKNCENEDIKFGLKTQSEFIDALKRRTDKCILESKMRIRMQELAVDTLKGIFILWCKEKKLLQTKAKNEEISELSDRNFMYKLEKLNQSKKLSKEDILKFYKFNPNITIDNDIQDRIENLEYSVKIEDNQDDLTQKYSETVLEQARRIAKNYSISVEDVAETLKSYDYKDVCEALESNEAEMEEVSNDDDLTSEDTDPETIDEQNDLTKEDLIEENEYLKSLVKKLEVNDVQKMKQSLENKIKELEQQLELKNSESDFDEDGENEEEVYKDKYYSLSKTLEKIKNLKISELDSKICSDKKYQQLIMSLILQNSVASKLLLKHLDITETSRNIIMDARTQISDLQQQKQDLENGSIQVNTKNNTGFDDVNNKKNNTFTYSSERADFSMSQYFKTLKDNINILYEDEALNIDIRKVTDGNFIIVNDERLIEALDMKWYGIPFCRVAVESNWKSIDDWFGYYDKEGKFIPSKTLISDYYRFVKDTMELPFGIVVFDNFNQIPPEIYIEPFIKNIETNGYYQLANPALIKDNCELGAIERLHNLKYIMIKSTNDTAFEIPNSMKKYELGA